MKPLCSLRLFSIFFSLLMYFLLVITSGCNDPENKTKGALVNRFKAYPAGSFGRHSFTAACEAGEQMVGGGFRLSTSNLDNNKIFVEGSFPASKNTWQVDVFQSSQQLDPSLDIVIVDCHCYTNAPYKLGMVVKSSDPHLANPTPPNVADFVDNCGCPQNAVVTAGGWKVSPPPGLTDQQWLDVLGGKGSNIPGVWGSWPQVAADNIPIGWNTHFIWGGATAASVSTFVLCSTGNPTGVLKKIGTGPVEPSLIPGPAKFEVAIVPTVNAAAERDGRVNCDPGYFSTGGGFEYTIVGVPDNPTATSTALIPHHLWWNSSQFSLPVSDPGSKVNNEFAGWSFFGFRGHEVHGDTKTTEAVKVWTVQIADLPPPVRIKITQPPNNSEIDITDRSTIPFSTLKFTAPVTFVAEAFDEDDSPITGNNIVWDVAGIPGVNETFTTPIEVDKGVFDASIQRLKYRVTATATGKNGGKASATVYLVNAIQVN